MGNIALACKLNVCYKYSYKLPIRLFKRPSFHVLLPKREICLLICFYYNRDFLLVLYIRGFIWLELFVKKSFGILSTIFSTDFCNE